MALNVGVNVVEVDGKTSPTIAAAATSVAGFLGATERGVPNQPVRVTNPQQFEERLGSYIASSYLAYAAAGFFLNGGQTAYVSRVVGAGSQPASSSLSNRQGAPGPALTVTAGHRGAADPGLWGQRIQIDVLDDPAGTTSLQSNTVANATSATLVSIQGFAVGTVVFFADGANTFYRKLTNVNPRTRTVSWAATAPIGPVLASATARVTTAEFKILVKYSVRQGMPAGLVETWGGLSMESDSARYAPDLINSSFTGSTYITVADTSGSAPTGLKNPAVISAQALTGGAENAPHVAELIGDPGSHTGLSSFDKSSIQLLAVPDAHFLNAADREALVRAGLDYCAERGDCMLVTSAPDRATAGGVVGRVESDYSELASDYLTRLKTYSAPLQATKVYGACYAPFIQVVDPIASGTAPTLFIPPDGHVMGVYARTDQERGVWKAPAGNQALVRGALDTSARFTDPEHTDLVVTGLVNAIRPTAGVGIVVSDSRTLSSGSLWRYVGVRLLFNFVKSSLRDGLRFVRQEPNTEDLRKRVRLNVVTPFLLGLWRRGAFGSDPPDAVFAIKCDAENNPPADVDQGYFRIEVYFYPTRPVETIVIVVGQQPSGASASES